MRYQEPSNTLSHPCSLSWGLRLSWNLLIADRDFKILRTLCQ